jgi:hypothetical protein
MRFASEQKNFKWYRGALLCVTGLGVHRVIKSQQMAQGNHNNICI